MKKKVFKMVLSLLLVSGSVMAVNTVIPKGHKCLLNGATGVCAPGLVCMPIYGEPGVGLCCPPY